MIFDKQFSLVFLLLNQNSLENSHLSSRAHSNNIICFNDLDLMEVKEQRQELKLKVML